VRAPRCDLPGCRRALRPDRLVRFVVNFDGHPLRGLACSQLHADETKRGWETRDAFGARFLPQTRPATPGRTTAA
jgi:hypothetical protein